MYVHSLSRDGTASYLLELRVQAVPEIPDPLGVGLHLLLGNAARSTQADHKLRRQRAAADATLLTATALQRLDAYARLPTNVQGCGASNECAHVRGLSRASE